jgi:periplasmic protein TonB
MNRIARLQTDDPDQRIAKDRRRFGLLVVALLATEAGCTISYPPPPLQGPPRDQGPESATPPAVPAQSVALSMDGYKRDVAQHIYRQCPDLLFDGPPPPTLRSIVVLALNIDANGRPNTVGLLRSNGFTDLEGVAMASVRRATPLPPPPRLIAHAGHVEFVETWLFRADGKFQIRSLADVQQDASALP